MVSKVNSVFLKKFPKGAAGVICVRKHEIFAFSEFAKCYITEYTHTQFVKWRFLSLQKMFKCTVWIMKVNTLEQVVCFRVCLCIRERPPYHLTKLLFQYIYFYFTPHNKVYTFLKVACVLVCVLYCRFYYQQSSQVLFLFFMQ